MRYGKLNCIEFYSLSCCSNASLIGLLAMARRVLWIRSVCPSVRKISWNWLFSFFWNLSWCWGPMWCYAWQRFFEIIFLPLKWGKQAKPRVLWNTLLENFVINFFWLWSIMKVYINCCMLEHISSLGKLWFLRYTPKCSRPMRLQDFKINYISRTKWQEILILCMFIQIHWN